MGLKLSNTLSTPRKLALAGIIANIVVTVIVAIFFIFIFSQLASLLEWIPDIPDIPDFPDMPTDLFPTIFSSMIIWIVVFLFIYQLIIGISLPAIGYMKTNPKSKNLAAALFIVSGVLTIPFIGGILLIVSGVILLVEESDAEYIPPKAEDRIQTTAKGKLVCANCNSPLMGDEDFCPICGTKVT